MAYWDFKQLDIWKRGMDISIDIYRITKSFPKEETFALSSQMQRTSTSIPSNIAEGHGRFSPKDFLRFIRMAQGSANELETQLEIALRLKYIDESVKNDISFRLLHLRNMMGSFALFLEKQDKTKPKDQSSKEGINFKP
ncbi:MAG: four helix bundle protein [Bacteroidales bacterium]|nr:four helix bundle protein [Bacteroidales bacterium]